MLFVFYVIFVLINSIHCQNAFKREVNPKLCNFFDTINITDGYHNPYDDSVIFNGIRFAKGNYATFTYTYLANDEKISVPAHIRGCICKYKNCVRLCCPVGHSFAQIKIGNNFGHKCEPNDSVHDIILDGYPDMVFVRGMPCTTGFLLDPAERLHQWKILYGAGKEIREAIKEPTPLTQERAWNAILPLVIKLKRCYEHSLELEKIVPKLLGQLVGGRLNPTQHLETQQALVKQLADILEFVLKFDEYKMKTPAIQNDFSYYRRTVVSRQRFENQSQMLVSSELANRMSLFYAHATPMLKVLSEATSKFVRDNADDVDNTTETLGTMAKVCLRMLDNPTLLKQIEREETQFLLLRVMVGLVILYDHVHPVGAFARGAHVDVKGCVRLLQQQPASKAEPLLNALRYTTKHLNEENTPKNIRNLLAA